MSLEEMMDKLQDRIQSALKMSFRDFSGIKKVITQEEKVHVIVSFLAILELVKQGILDVKQESRFDDIEIEKTSVGIPVY
jgi:segregation and condensation protein A